MGSHRSKRWLLEPARERTLASAAARGHRDAARRTARPLRHALKGASDVERITARIALRQCDRANSSDWCTRWKKRPASRRACGNCCGRSPATALTQQARLLAELAPRPRAARDCAILLHRALLPEPAALVRDGGVINHGFDADLDELRAIQGNCDGFLLELEARERARTGIQNLRVQYNKVHGFYIEVTQGQLDKVPDDYRRRQTLKNAERFITPELKAFEDKALSAKSERWREKMALRGSA